MRKQYMITLYQRYCKDFKELGGLADQASCRMTKCSDLKPGIEQSIFFMGV
ncbi:unnamed protein product, partial [marine sediment metagenome]